MTGLELLEKLNKLSEQQLSHEIWFANEDICAKVHTSIDRVTDPIDVDNEYCETFNESDYSEEEIQEWLDEGSISLAVGYGDLTLTSE